MTVMENTTIRHSLADEVAPFENNKELVANSGLTTSALIRTEYDKRLSDPEPLEACELA